MLYDSEFCGSLGTVIKEESLSDQTNPWTACFEDNDGLWTAPGVRTSLCRGTLEVNAGTAAPTFNGLNVDHPNSLFVETANHTTDQKPVSTAEAFPTTTVAMVGRSSVVEVKIDTSVAASSVYATPSVERGSGGLPASLCHSVPPLSLRPSSCLYAASDVGKGQRMDSSAVTSLDSSVAQQDQFEDSGSDFVFAEGSLIDNAHYSNERMSPGGHSNSRSCTPRRPSPQVKLEDHIGCLSNKAPPSSLNTPHDIAHSPHSDLAQVPSQDHPNSSEFAFVEFSPSGGEECESIEQIQGSIRTDTSLGLTDNASHLEYGNAQQLNSTIDHAACFAPPAAPTTASGDQADAMMDDFAALVGLAFPLCAHSANGAHAPAAPNGLLGQMSPVEVDTLNFGASCSGEIRAAVRGGQGEGSLAGCLSPNSFLDNLVCAPTLDPLSPPPTAGVDDSPGHVSDLAGLQLDPLGQLTSGQQWTSEDGSPLGGAWGSSELLSVGGAVTLLLAASSTNTKDSGAVSLGLHPPDQAAQSELRDNMGHGIEYFAAAADTVGVASGTQAPSHASSCNLLCLGNSRVGGDSGHGSSATHNNGLNLHQPFYKEETKSTKKRSTKSGSVGNSGGSSAGRNSGLSLTSAGANAAIADTLAGDLNSSTGGKISCCRGVYYDHVRQLWRANWPEETVYVDRNTRRKLDVRRCTRTKGFSAKKYGHQQAQRLAIAYRERMTGIGLVKHEVFVDPSTMSQLHLPAGKHNSCVATGHGNGKGGNKSTGDNLGHLAAVDGGTQIPMDISRTGNAAGFSPRSSKRNVAANQVVIAAVSGASVGCLPSALAAPSPWDNTAVNDLLEPTRTTINSVGCEFGVGAESLLAGSDVSCEAGSASEAVGTHTAATGNTGFSPDDSATPAIGTPDELGSGAGSLLQLGGLSSPDDGGSDSTGDTLLTTASPPTELDHVMSLFANAYLLGSQPLSPAAVTGVSGIPADDSGTTPTDGVAVYDGTNKACRPYQDSRRQPPAGNHDDCVDSGAVYYTGYRATSTAGRPAVTTAISSTAIGSASSNELLQWGEGNCGPEPECLTVSNSSGGVAGGERGDLMEDGVTTPMSAIPGDVDLHYVWLHDVVAGPPTDGCSSGAAPMMSLDRGSSLSRLPSTESASVMCDSSFIGSSANCQVFTSTLSLGPPSSEASTVADCNSSSSGNSPLGARTSGNSATGYTSLRGGPFGHPLSLGRVECNISKVPAADFLFRSLNVAPAIDTTTVGQTATKIPSGFHRGVVAGSSSVSGPTSSSPMEAAVKNYGVQSMRMLSPLSSGLGLVAKAGAGTVADSDLIYIMDDYLAAAAAAESPRASSSGDSLMMHLGLREN